MESSHPNEETFLGVEVGGSFGTRDPVGETEKSYTEKLLVTGTVHNTRGPSSLLPRRGGRSP